VRNQNITRRRQSKGGTKVGYARGRKLCATTHGKKVTRKAPPALYSATSKHSSTGTYETPIVLDVQSCQSTTRSILRVATSIHQTWCGSPLTDRGRDARPRKINEDHVGEKQHLTSVPDP